jgi:hypothetical protein
MAKSIVMSRREALLLSATAGFSLATGRPALASDSSKTGAHQEPGCGRDQTVPARNMDGSKAEAEDKCEGLQHAVAQL